MSKKILFSPIGGTDPIASSTERDGSMLHICRVYKPDVVYLYLSKEMLERQQLDDRYRYCIERLGERLDHKFEIHCIERGDLVEVQQYDYYYEDLKKIVEEIEDGMEEDDILLANIASGTPAMKSSLLVLATMSEYNFIPVQVETPAKGINSHPGKEADYDVEYYWELNKDNEEDFPNRCQEVKCPNLVTILKKNIISRHIRSYDYAAAYRLTGEIRKDTSKNCYLMLEAAVARQQLDLAKVNSIMNRVGKEFMPVKSGDQINLFEYALAMNIKIHRKEYGDFVRAISPLIADLFEMILKNRCGIDVRNYCEKKNGVWCWSNSKLNKTTKGKEIMTVLNNKFQDFASRRTPVAASNLQPLLAAYLQDKKLVQKINDMRDIEAKVRNLAAHEIVSITDSNLPSILGKAISVQGIFDMIKTLVMGAGINISKEDWKSYDKMNEMIIEELNI